MKKEQFANGTTPSSMQSEGSNSIGFSQSDWIKNIRYYEHASHWGKIAQFKINKFSLSFIRWLSVTKKTTKILLEIYPTVWKHYSNFGDILTKEEQYHHYRWMKKSKQIMLRDCYTCKHCGKTKTHLQVFPVYTDENKYPWELDDDGLKTVCDDCLKLLAKRHSKTAGIIEFEWSSGRLDVSNLNFKP